MFKENNCTIFVISGKARSGKDTISNFIKKTSNKKTLILHYASYIKEYAKIISDWDGNEDTKPRKLLQELGTDVIRKNIDELFFVNRMIEDIKVFSYFFDIIVISDARFKDEIDKIKENFNNVISVNIVRTNFDNGLTEEQKNHPTEIDLDDYNKFDYKLINDGTLEELKLKVDSLLKEVQHES